MLTKVRKNINQQITDLSQPVLLAMKGHPSFQEGTVRSVGPEALDWDLHTNRCRETNEYPIMVLPGEELDIPFAGKKSGARYYIYWMGDLDRDGHLDLIGEWQSYYISKKTTILYLSSEADSSQFLRKVATYSVRERLKCWAGSH